VIGPRDRAGGASQAAGAMLGSFCEVTTDTFRTDLGRARFEVGLDAHHLWQDVLERLQNAAPDGRSLKVADDAYIILNSVGSAFDTANYNAIKDALKEYNRPWSEVDPTQITGFNPKPCSRAFRAIHLPSEGAVDARGVLAALEQVLHRSNIPVIDQTVAQVLTNGGTVTGVKLDDGTVIEAETVVIAAGARSEELARSADETFDIIPTFPGLGLGLITKRQGGKGFKSVVRTPNRAFACGLHVVPSGDGREYLGSTNRIVPEVAHGACFEDLSYFTRCAMEQLDENIANHHIERLLQGNRPVTMDGYPLIGALPVAGLFMATGTYRDGLHCAPQIAVYLSIADLVRCDGRS